MDDLIPFLIVIAISIIGAASRKKRKRDAVGNITSQPTSKRSDDIFSWLEKFSGEEETNIPYQETNNQQNIFVSETKNQTSTENQIEKGPKNISKMISTADKIALAEEIKANNPKKDSSKSVKIHPANKKIKQQFNLRKAVIYSEILNRKYN